MLGWLKDKAQGAHAALQAQAAQYRDKETAEAVVAIMCGTAYADGQLEDAEKKKFIAALKVNPLLKQFDSAVLVRKWDELAQQCEFDAAHGQDMCMKEILEALKGADEGKRLMIMRMGVAVAKADAEGMEDAEAAWLRKCCNTLGVPAGELGL